MADFDEATQLSDTADVRIAGVTVGKVLATELTGNGTRATMQIDPRYAPSTRTRARSSARRRCSARPTSR